MPGNSQIKALAFTVIAELAELHPLIKWETKSGSIMIGFRDERLKTVRISDHDNPRYMTRWNLRSDIELSDCLEIDGGGAGRYGKGVARYYYQWNDWKLMCAAIMEMAVKLPYLVDYDEKTGEQIPLLPGQKEANWRRR